MTARIALIGGRGYTGAELLGLIAGHSGMSLALASSGSQAGQAIRSVCPNWPDDACFSSLSMAQIGAVEADAWVLAVPNGVARDWADAIAQAHPHNVILDLSADHRFDPDWTYGLPEHHRSALTSTRRIANPGCYATAAQLSLWPLRDQLQGVPVLFGVSGYSGAGRTPSARNNPERLKDNLLAYGLNGHVHEREIGFQLGRDVRFVPHVAAFFRGISMTSSFEIDKALSAQDLYELYADRYAGEPMVRVMREIPEVAAVCNSPQAHVGGFSVDDRDPRRVTVVSVLDNLAKGAASQAMQNLNLALGLPETAGLDQPAKDLT